MLLDHASKRTRQGATVPHGGQSFAAHIGCECSAACDRDHGVVVGRCVKQSKVILNLLSRVPSTENALSRAD